MNSRPPLFLSRPQVVRGLLATGAFGITARFGTGCTPAPAATTSSTTGAGAANMGFIYVGAKDDYGWNQAHHEGAAGVSKELTWAKTVEEASVPETTAVEETMLNMINQDGITALFPTSYGYFDPYILKVAKEYPEVQFFHCGSLYQEGVSPKNVGSYFGDVDESQYIAGVVAASTFKTKKLGFIAAKPINPVLRNINGFTLGARSVDPATGALGTNN
ncbi:BMP family ABC transporter substrate-binding protein [Leptolyngbya sp. FACHB-261]|uniref:BMP family ABC transporter substrate-binding protein n=1 Tax=Leptolyngbya sp. FACHB-261 TaxID=2692806 RepID=UPI00168A3AEE|nr:BMP family ABC transporter substrate-binding protein [Leptolyngbya sp. FACHB-261]MBD2104555.1 BMP family ABC transporter substrate-binding protein [Leptolyngbya sp. FACHB-261]